jgi:hypothetical protein
MAEPGLGCVQFRDVADEDRVGLGLTARVFLGVELAEELKPSLDEGLVRWGCLSPQEALVEDSAHRLGVAARIEFVKVEEDAANSASPSDEIGILPQSLRRPLLEELPKFILGLVENLPLTGVKVSTGSVDVEVQHRHR